MKPFDRVLSINVGLAGRWTLFLAALGSVLVLCTDFAEVRRGIPIMSRASCSEAPSYLALVLHSTTG